MCGFPHGFARSGGGCGWPWARLSMQFIPGRELGGKSHWKESQAHCSKRGEKLSKTPIRMRDSIRANDRIRLPAAH